MKNLNILLATAMFFSVSVNAVFESSVIKTTDKFRGTMICNQKGRGLSLKVVNLETNETVLNLKFDSEKLATGFDLTDSLAKVHFYKGLQTFEYQIAAAACKKCKAVPTAQEAKQLIGQLVAIKAAGIIPMPKNLNAPVNQK